MVPKSIALFEKIAYLALALGIASVVINYPVTIKTPGATANMVVAIQSLSVVLQILFIWLIARRRKNWARWIWIAVMFGGTAIAIVMGFSHPVPQNGLAGSAAFYLVYVASLVSAICLLQADAWAWFRAPAADITP
jgi:hypothetical protein